VASACHRAFPALLQHHAVLLWQPPRLVTGSRRLHARGRDAAAQRLRVRHVGIPWTSERHPSAAERGPARERTGPDLAAPLLLAGGHRGVQSRAQFIACAATAGSCAAARSAQSVWNAMWGGSAVLASDLHLLAISSGPWPPGASAC